MLKLATAGLGTSNSEPLWPHRLWSLWDMLDKYGLLFAQGILALSEAKILCMPLQLKDGERQLTDEEIANLVSNGAHTMRRACIMADMDGVLPELDRLVQLVRPIYPDTPVAPRTSIAQAIVHLTSRVQDELQQQFFFHISQEDVRFYGKKAIFGDKVATKFKSAVVDIESAGNCLALQQPTACVFHLMRAMEIAVRRLSGRLKVTIAPQTTWRQMTGNMDPKIKAMPEKTESQKRKKNDWEAARANLHHVGSVWRNNTMHPANSYTRSQARDVFNAVRVFMSGLADL